MKNKTKVVVGLAAMLAGTIGVAGVSTFAWFQTQNNAKITFTDAVVRGDTTSIAVSYDKGKQPSKNGLVTEAGADATGITSDNTKSSLVSISGAKTEVIDLSGNGREFYHPNNYKKVEETESADSVKANITNGNSTFYLAFNVIVTNKGNQPTDVFLTSGSVVSVAGEAKSSSTEAQKAARVAIWQQGATVTGAVPGSDATLRTLWSSGTADTNGKFLSKTSNMTTPPTTKAFGLTGANDPYLNTIRDAKATGEPDLLNEEKVFHKGNFSAAPSTTNAAIDAAAEPTTTHDKGSWLCLLPALNSSVTINISMWIEGTDSAGDEDCIDGHIGLELDLSAAQRTVA